MTATSWSDPQVSDTVTDRTTVLRVVDVDLEADEADRGRPGQSPVKARREVGVARRVQRYVQKEAEPQRANKSAGRDFINPLTYHFTYPIFGWCNSLTRINRKKYH